MIKTQFPMSRPKPLLRELMAALYHPSWSFKPEIQEFFRVLGKPRNRSELPEGDCKILAPRAPPPSRRFFPPAIRDDGRISTFEVYSSLEAATAADSRLTVSQIALPEETCNEVHASAGYEQSVAVAEVSRATDGVFADDRGDQLWTIEESVEEGLTVRLTIAV